MIELIPYFLLEKDSNKIYGSIYFYQSKKRIIELIKKKSRNRVIELILI